MNVHDHHPARRRRKFVKHSQTSIGQLIGLTRSAGQTPSL